MKRAPRPCSVPGCGELVFTARAQCERHQREASARRGTASERGYDAKWRRIRAQYLKAHPWCEWHGAPVRSTQVDHKDGDSRHSQWSNLRALCASCHSKRTQRDQPGGWNRRGA